MFFLGRKGEWGLCLARIGTPVQSEEGVNCFYVNTYVSAGLVVCVANAVTRLEGEIGEKNVERAKKQKHFELVLKDKFHVHCCKS